MTKEELEKELKSVRDRKFFLEMEDRWGDDEYDLMRKLRRKEEELLKAIEKTSQKPPRTTSQFGTKESN